MEIIQIKTVWGPNFYHRRPVLYALVSLGRWAEVHSAELPGFVDRLWALLPGLQAHGCSMPQEGGFAERMRRGTYIAHIIEHVALELSALAGIPVGYGKTVYAGEPGTYRIVVRFESEAGMKFLLKVALDLVQACAESREFSLAPLLEEAKCIIRAVELGPSTKAVLKAAELRGIPFRRLNRESLMQLGYGCHRKFLQATTSSHTSDIAADIAQDKELTKLLLSRALLPVPKGESVASAAEAIAAAKRINAPVAIKPLDSHQGNGVSLNLVSENDLARAFAQAKAHSQKVVVEEYFAGHDIRILVVNGKAVAASCREPPFVIGNGKQCISELIDEENRNPERGAGHENVLTRIEKDSALEELLLRRGTSLTHVPARGERLCLRDTANLSTGGSATDVTDTIHPSFLSLSELAAQIIGLDICGVDIVAESLSEPWLGQRAAILELNAGPGLRMHNNPTRGASRDVGSAIIEYLFPSGEQGRIPIVAITGTNGKTTVARMLGLILEDSGKRTGVTTTDGVLLGGEFIAKGDMAGPKSAEALLANPLVEVAVLETARGGILKSGLGYDWSDVGVLTNIQLDHIGQDGIETTDDILAIKSLVAERVKEGGTLIINAEDSHLLRMLEFPAVKRLLRRHVLFARSPAVPAIRRHLSLGGNAFFERNGLLWESGPEEEIPIVSVAELPVTLGGSAGFQVSNALAAISAARSLGIGCHQIAASLRRFDNCRNNAGRVNLYRLNRGFLLLDYGHNPQAFSEICKMASQWKKRRVTGIVGLPGDRSDEVIELAAKNAAKGFDKIFVREDEDLRGRAPGETASLILQAARKERPGLHFEVELNELRCIERAIREMEEGEVIVCFYESLAPIQKLLERHGAEPMKSSREIYSQEGSWSAAS